MARSVCNLRINSYSLSRIFFLKKVNSWSVARNVCALELNNYFILDFFFLNRIFLAYRYLSWCLLKHNMEQSWIEYVIWLKKVENKNRVANVILRKDVSKLRTMDINRKISTNNPAWEMKYNKTILSSSYVNRIKNDTVRGNIREVTGLFEDFITTVKWRNVTRANNLPLSSLKVLPQADEEAVI